MGKIRLGIIGAGRIGNVHAKSIVNCVKDAQLVAISDIILEKAKKLANELGVPNYYKDNSELLKNNEIDAVLICTPTDTHVDICEQAAEAKKHVFCEKPIDLSIERIVKLIKIIEKQNIKMQVGFNRRFDHNHNRIHKMIIDGKLGEIYSVNIISRDPALPTVEFLKSSGGMIYDMSIHDFDMAVFLTGSTVEEIYTKATVRLNEIVKLANDVDTAVFLIKMKNGVLVTIHNCRATSYGYDQRIEVFGSKGMAIDNNDTETNVKYYCDKGIIQDKPLYFFLERYMGSYSEEIRQFVSSIANGNQTPVSAREGFYPTLIALAAKKSLEENRPVKIEEFMNFEK